MCHNKRAEFFGLSGITVVQAFTCDWMYCVLVVFAVDGIYELYFSAEAAREFSSQALTLCADSYLVSVPPL